MAAALGIAASPDVVAGPRQAIQTGEAMSRRLLVVGKTLHVGGTENHLLQVLPRLAARGYEVRLFLLQRSGALVPKMEEAGVAVSGPATTLARPLQLLWAFLHLFPLMLRWRPAFVHCFLAEPYIVGGMAAILTRRPFRLMSRRSLSDYQRRYPGLAWLEMQLHSRMQAVLGNSQAVLQQLRREGIPEQRLHLIYNGVALPHLPSRAQARQRLELAHTDWVLLKVANLIPYKGHADLIAAMALAKDSLRQRTVILCAGLDDGTGEVLRTRAEELGVAAHFRWLGSRSDIPTLLAAADVGLLCSHQEGFSNSILEGMAAGLPMIVTDAGGNREAVVDGQCGIVVQPRNPAALGQAIIRLAEDKDASERFGQAASQRARDWFSVEATVDRYAALYESLAKSA